ncbi:RNA-directed DNA polymerase, eukaryota [Tanacetum coccineum]
MSPTSSIDNSEAMLKKKRKVPQVNEIGEDTFDKSFNQGKVCVEIQISKTKTGRRSVRKAKEVARKVGVEGLGDATKGISDAYKEFHEDDKDNNEVFKFGDNHMRVEDNEKCEITIEQIKEVGEMIGVLWLQAETKRKQEGSCEVAEGDVGRVRGTGESGKKGWIKTIIRTERPNLIGLQETKCDVFDDEWVKELWGSNGYGYAQLPSNGNSRGILIIWDKRGSWKGKDEDVFLICICGPHVSRQKASSKDKISRLMNRWEGAWCIFGDLNVVRCGDDRLNSQINLKEASEYNDFINNMRLIEIPMGGRKFTRISKVGLKFNKLDRFLLNDRFNNLWDNLSVVALDRKLFDHCPIVLKDVELDFGPKPFHVFNVWLDDTDFNQVVEEAWKKDVGTIRGCGGDKSPGPGGFKFIRKTWDIIKRDLVGAIMWFWESMEISRGCNASFITIIPKRKDTIGQGDFRPISLIGS